MEPYNCELLTSVQSTQETSNENCRLRNGLNGHCLLLVFDSLSEWDLIQVCKVDKYFKELITKETLKKKLLDLVDLQYRSDEAQISYLHDVSKFFEIFETFGKSMRRFKLTTNNFTLTLQLIIKYCEPAKLTEIDLELCRLEDFEDFDLDVLRLAMPFFSKLRKLKIDAAYADTNMLVEFFTQLATTAPNLQILHLIAVMPDKEWLNNMHNLRELHLYGVNPRLISFDGLTSGLKKLKIFKIDSFQNIATIGDALSKQCPDLEEFSDVHLENPYKRIDLELINRYNFLSSFPYLNNVTLTSYTFCGCDLYYPLTTLATKNICKLKVYTGMDTPIFLSKEEKALIMRRSLPNFVCLHTLEIRNHKNLAHGENVTDVDPKWTQCDLRCEFIFHFVSQLKNLKCVRFLGREQTNMHKILEVSPSIQTLDVSVSDDMHTPEAIQNMAKVLRTFRQLNDGGKEHKLLHLIAPVNSSNINYQDFADVMKISYRKVNEFKVFDRFESQCAYLAVRRLQQ